MIVMAHKNYTTGIAEFICDTVAELDDLPKIDQAGKKNLKTVKSCSPGSTAIITETSEEYILSGEKNEWVAASFSSKKKGGDTSVITGFGLYGIIVDPEIIMGSIYEEVV